MSAKPKTKLTAKSAKKSAAKKPLLQAIKLNKSFGDFKANDDVSFQIFPGEIHALLGENGAGKSTFVKLVYGLLQPDSGALLWHGETILVRGPQQARQLGIGMVFQHFSLFNALTVAENIQLAMPPGESIAQLSGRISRISEEYGIGVDPNARVHNLSVGQQQRVEIIRCLLQDPKLLIMDEPTSVLTPQEAEQLFTVLRRFAEKGMAVLFISHKLDEIRALTSRATVLRRGQVVGSVNTKGQTNRQLAEMMIGTKVKDVARQKAPANAPVLFKVNGLTRPNETVFSVALNNISLCARAGEILGIAGIAGNGQDELMTALIGEWRGQQQGVMLLNGMDITQQGPAERRVSGVGFVPEERNGHGAVPSMSLADNALLTNHSLDGAARFGLIDLGGMRKKAAAIAAAFDVRLPGENPLASLLSGGNLQKFVVGREIIKTPKLLIVAQPTWGVDVGAAVFIRKAMLDLVSKGSAVIMISQDLEEIFAISHRVSVLHGGKLSAAVPAAKLTAQKVGLLMGGSAPVTGGSTPAAEASI